MDHIVNLTIQLPLHSFGSLSSEELEVYLNEEGDEKLDEFVKSLNQVKELYREKEMLLASNKSLAEYNLSQKPILESEYEALVTKRNEAVELAKKCQSSAYAEAEEFSEKLSDGFLDGSEESLDDFLEKFQEARNLSHSRRVKVDKMKEIIAKESSMPSSRIPEPVGALPPPSIQIPYPHYSNWNASSCNPSVPPLSALPYPTQPTSMIYPFMPAYPPIP
ncbi:VPS37 [Lepeophtheirus salmonis]|uniref:VPS37 n=1 Tax=Lepeophtheirus salmonis TaxID=72036 RepID=A0A7R8CL76_LEPSM|nr:VPS37 [Lepeophtheirus salmonis]CAF2853339.1 VPS37 [Lepeophtheirus salmonis]